MGERGFACLFKRKLGFRGGSVVKNLPAMQETWVWSLNCENPLEEEMATYSSILAWKIPWTGDSGGLLSMGSQRVGHDWATNTLKENYFNEPLKLRSIHPWRMCCTWQVIPSTCTISLLNEEAACYSWAEKHGSRTSRDLISGCSGLWAPLVIEQTEQFKTQFHSEPGAWGSLAHKSSRASFSVFWKEGNKEYTFS